MSEYSWPKMFYEQDARGKWRWTYKARNGRIIDSSSQGFSTRSNAIRNAWAVIGRNKEQAARQPYQL